MKSILGRHSQKVRRREKGRKYDDLLKGGENVGSMVGQKRRKKKASGNQQICITLKVTKIHIWKIISLFFSNDFNSIPFLRYSSFPQNSF